MRIKQKELIGKVPQIMYTKTLSSQSIIIIQVFDNPKCVNLIKEVKDKVVERQCYPLDDKQYQVYIDSYNKYRDKSVDGLFANNMANKSKDNCMKTFWKKLRNYLWSQLLVHC